MLQNKIRRRPNLEHSISRKGWLFVLPATLLIAVLCFFPMIQAALLSIKTGKGNALKWAEPFYYNYARLFKDKTFITAIQNTLFYLVIQVPIMLTMALILAAMLNDKKLLGRGVYRTLIFLPCATSLVSCAIIFKQLFAANGFINTQLMSAGWTNEPINFLTDGVLARLVIIVTMLWRWTGYNMVFYLAGLQNIDTQVYEAARIDGASVVQQFTKITVPLLRPIILLTTVLSTNGTLQLFDEVYNMAIGSTGNQTITLSVYIYRLTFLNVPQFGYASALAYTIFLAVAALAFVQLKVGDSK